LSEKVTNKEANKEESRGERRAGATMIT
jgi:hypothetical protein